MEQHTMAVRKPITQKLVATLPASLQDACNHFASEYDCTVIEIIPMVRAAMGDFKPTLDGMVNADGAIDVFWYRNNYMLNVLIWKVRSNTPC
jgi:hypothetical protein